MTHSAWPQLPPNVSPAMLAVDFWLDRVEYPDAPLLTATELNAFNARVPKVLNIPPVLSLPDTMDADDVRQQISAYAPPAKPRYGSTGQLLDAGYWQRLTTNAAPDLPDQVPVRFGLITRRAEVRAFPASDVITSRPYEFPLDRSQETTVDIGWPVAVLATSRDACWHFCLTPNYWGWVRVDHIALAPRDTIAAYVNSEPFVTTITSRGLVALPEVGGVTPQMGTRLPLVGVSPDSFSIQVPVRADEGALAFTNGIAARSTGEFGAGCLPLTLRTVFSQVCTLLGEPYAWGGSRLGIFGRDCSRLVRDVFATAGLYLPRNGDQQLKACTRQIIFIPDMQDSERQDALITYATPGALLGLPGHIMLYLGHVNGIPYAIHATSSGQYSNVIVSDLSLGAGGPSGSLLRRLTEAVAITGSSNSL